MRRVLIALVALLATACTAGPAGSTSPAVASTVSASPPQPEPSSSTSGAAPPGEATTGIVGEWVGTHDCRRIVKILFEAGLNEFLADAIYGNGLVPGMDPNTKTVEDPRYVCDDAVQRAHSHFFTADGQFGSKDFAGQQVDEGAYRLEGEDMEGLYHSTFHHSRHGRE